MKTSFAFCLLYLCYFYTSVMTILYTKDELEAGYSHADSHGYKKRNLLNRIQNISTGIINLINDIKQMENILQHMPAINLALRKPATQNRTYYGYEASYGVDGNVSTYALLLQHWQVDLQKPAVIRRIVLRASLEHGGNTLCVKIDGVGCDACINVTSEANTRTLVCNPPLTGQIISVEKQPGSGGYLLVYELEAFSF